MRRNFVDLLLAVLVAILTVLWALLPEHPAWAGFVGVILALPLVFVLPGYTLTEAIFSRWTLAASHRLILSLGLSLALDILSGFLLNELPGGLQMLSWAILLGLLTTIFVLVAAYMRLREQRKLRGQQVPVRQGTRARWLPFSVPACLLMALAIVVAVLSVRYAVVGVQQQPRPGFTQLWILPATVTGTDCSVQLGVRSFENAPVTYRMTVAMNGKPLQSWSAISLTPQEMWNHVVAVPPGIAGSVYLDVRLYRVDQPQVVYRTVHLTLYGVGGNAEHMGTGCSAT